MAKGTRRTRKGGWRQTAPLIPVALFAGAFTVQASEDPVATASLGHDPVSAQGDPITVPGRAIEEPANVVIPGQIANNIPPGTNQEQLVSGLSRNGIPEAALLAYSRTQQVMAQVDQSCNLPWTLIAAIGRVESNHGRYGGNVVRDDGSVSPGIYGPRLDGGNTARIVDSDNGDLDGDTAFDRAIGPMQFIPSTWRTVGVDGDADGVKNPQDIDDAAMATGVYLCSGSTNLANAGDLTEALLRYNHSQSYVDVVLSIANAYAGGAWVAVENGRREGDNKGVHRKDDRTQARGERDRPGDENWLSKPLKPPTPTATNHPDRDKPTPTKPTATKPTPTKPGTTKPPTSKPPTSKPPTQKPPLQNPIATIQTTVGIITGTVGTTLGELTRAATFCQAEMKDSKIPANQARLQNCVNAYLEGGAKAVDQLIRDLLKILGLLGILGG